MYTKTLDLCKRAAKSNKMAIVKRHFSEFTDNDKSTLLMFARRYESDTVERFLAHHSVLPLFLSFENAYQLETQYLMDNYTQDMCTSCKDPLLEIFRILVVITAEITEDGLFSYVIGRIDQLSDWTVEILDDLEYSLTTEPFLQARNINYFISSIRKLEKEIPSMDLDTIKFTEKSIINNGAFAITDVIEYISLNREYKLSSKK